MFSVIQLFKEDKEVEVSKLASALINKKIRQEDDIKAQYLTITKVGNTNADELKTIVQKIVETNPGPVAEYKKGKTNILGFFVGQAMKESKGTASPQVLSEIVAKLLSEI